MYKSAMTAMLYTLGVFALILVLTRLKAPLAAAILAGALAIGFAFGLGVPEIASAALAGAVKSKTISLVVITVLLLGLSAMMQAGGQMKRIVSLASAMLRRPGVTMAALPALIGLLPMPGGALFSAPMVQSAAGDNKVSGNVLSAINFWFRHIWEHWWPLYPGVILAMTLTNSDYGQFAIFQFPLGLSMAAAGLLLFRGTHPDLHAKSAPPPTGTKRRLIWATSSIWIIVLAWVAARVAYAWLVEPHLAEGPREAMAPIKMYIPLVAGLLVSIIWTARMNRLGGRTVAKIFAGKNLYTLGGLVVSVMIFQHMLERVDAAGEIAAELMKLHIPVVLVVVALPFIAGMVTGLAVGFVGTSFPIVLGLVAAMDGGGSIRPYMVLAYAFGHLGQMTSPIHLCLIVSNEYFKTSFGAVYRRLLPSAIVTACLATLYFIILRMTM
jgi:hypothetical protein